MKKKKHFTANRIENEEDTKSPPSPKLQKPPDGAFFTIDVVRAGSLDRVRLPLFRYLRAFKATTASFFIHHCLLARAREHATGKERQAGAQLATESGCVCVCLLVAADDYLNVAKL